MNVVQRFATHNNATRDLFSVIYVARAAEFISCALM